MNDPVPHTIDDGNRFGEIKTPLVRFLLRLYRRSHAAVSPPMVTQTYLHNLIRTFSDIYRYFLLIFVDSVIRLLTVHENIHLFFSNSMSNHA